MAAELRDGILDAAAECFVRYGPWRTTIADVAALAGCSRPTVYKHVGDRDGLAAALLEREWGRLRQAVTTELDRHAGAVAKLVEAVVFSVGYVRSHPVFQRLLACEPHAVLPGLTTEAEPLLRAAIDLLGPIVEDGRVRGELPAGVDPTVVAEWTARLALSLMATPSVTVDVDDPAALRRMVEGLFHVGLDRAGRRRRAPARSSAPAGSSAGPARSPAPSPLTGAAGGPVGAGRGAR
ncbi:MAG: TetR/AcrR family transcriptional regulator [Actinomycetota bacterium]